MRDSVGGTFMIYVLLIFLAVYITFVAVAFNYARAFRVKNKVIDVIEQNEGIVNYENKSSDSAMGQIEVYLNEVSYYVNLSESNKKDRGTCFDRGYCIDEYSTSVEGVTAKYYKVTTFVRLEIPFLEIGFTIPVKGETRKIVMVNR